MKKSWKYNESEQEYLTCIHFTSFPLIRCVFWWWILIVILAVTIGNENPQYLWTKNPNPWSISFVKPTIVENAQCRTLRGHDKNRLFSDAMEKRPRCGIRTLNSIWALNHSSLRIVFEKKLDHGWGATSVIFVAWTLHSLNCLANRWWSYQVRCHLPFGKKKSPIR